VKIREIRGKKMKQTLKTSILTSLAALGFLAACSAAVPETAPAAVPTPTFDASKFGTAQLDLTYCTPDDIPQYMDLYFPQSGGPWPVLLYVHGGSWREGDKAEGEGWRGMNDSGFLIAAINYRMAAEGKFPVMIEDVKCAVRYLRANAAELNINPDRIGAIGASAGAHLVALLGTAGKEAGWDEGQYADHSSQVQAVLSMAGFSDFTADMPSGINSSIYYAFGELAGSDDPKNVAASPVTYITPDDPPFLIIHGDNDGVAPVEQSQILHARLTEAGVPSTLIIVEGGDHSLQGPDTASTQEEISAAINEFFESTLKE
jgi:acetyl esterase/lipase